MYSCPTDDIHSIYIDNELPLAFLKEYESHLETCAECRAKLDELKKLKAAFNADSRNISTDKAFLDQSFERLQTKLRYSKNTANVHQFKPAVSDSVIKFGIGAAAAVIIAAVLPVSLSNFSNANSNTVASITPVTRPQTAPVHQNVVINGNLNRSLAQTVSTRNFSNSSLTDVDVLRPEFDDSRKIHVNITIPGLDENNPQTIEINLPENSYEGQLYWNRHQH